MRTAGGAGSWHFWSGGCLFSQYSAEGIVTRHRQLRLPCPSGNRFGSGIEKVPEPSGFIWSSNSFYPWIDKGCYNLLGQEPHVCNLLSNVAISWTPKQWLEAYRCESCTASQQESFFCRNRLLDASQHLTQLLYPKLSDLESANLGLF